MTEQLERELAEMFLDRAERLDVRPPLPAARVRRIRLQSGLALASVLAVLAGIGLAGVRIATGSGGSDARMVTASGQQARDDLTAAFRRTLAGEAEATTTTVEVPSGKFVDAPDLGYSLAGRAPTQTVDTKYDGRVGDAVAMAGGQVAGMVVHDVLYRRAEPQYVGSVFSLGVVWVRYTKDDTERLSDWRDETIAAQIPALSALYVAPGAVEADEHDGRIRLTSSDMGGMRFVAVIQLDRSGRIQTLTTRYVMTVPNAVSDRVERVTFRPLDGPIPEAATPIAASVISSDAYDAGKKTYDVQHPKCISTPASTGPDGTTSSTSCIGTLQPVPDGLTIDNGAGVVTVPAQPAGPAPSSSPR